MENWMFYLEICHHPIFVHAECCHICFCISGSIIIIAALAFLQVLDSSQKLLPPDELRKRFEQEGNIPSI